VSGGSDGHWASELPGCFGDDRPAGEKGREQGRQRLAATVVVLVVRREDGDDRAGVDQDPLSRARSLPCTWCSPRSVAGEWVVVTWLLLKVEEGRYWAAMPVHYASPGNRPPVSTVRSLGHLAPTAVELGTQPEDYRPDPDREVAPDLAVGR
jgi:hypothetical protein